MWNGDEHSEPFLNEANYFRNRVDGRRDMYTESLYVSEGGRVRGASMCAIGNTQHAPRRTEDAAPSPSPFLVPWSGLPRDDVPQKRGSVKSLWVEFECR